MSMVLTHTTTAPILTLQLTLKSREERITDEISTIIKEMLSSNFFDDQTKTLISSWEKEFIENFRSLESQDQCDDASLCICAMICEIIRPVITKNDKMLDLEDSWKAILQKIVPEGDDADKLVQEFYEASLDQAHFEKIKNFTDAQTDQQLNKIIDLANDTIAKVQKAHFEILERMTKLSLIGKNIVAASEHAVNHVTTQVVALHDAQKNAVAKVQLLSQNIIQQAATDKKVIEEGMKIIKK